MKNLFNSLAPLFAFALLVSPAAVRAQGMMSGFFNPQGDISISAGYTSGTADAFYVGETRMEGIPVHGEFQQNIYSIYATYSILDDLTFVASLPFIDVQNETGAADPINGNTDDSGLQDVSLALKYRFGSADLGAGRLDFLAGVAGSIASGYEPNGIISIGNGANAAELSLGTQLNLDGGLFASVVAGYSLRGEADNTFGNGGTEDFDVPNALTGIAKVGYAGARVYGELFFDFQNTADGIDISDMDFGGRFPLTQVNYSRIGGSVFVPVVSGLGVSVNYSTIIDGRNIADFSYIGGGITYTIHTK